MLVMELYWAQHWGIKMSRKEDEFCTNFVSNVFLLGSKLIGQYGGYETFVDKLTEQHQNEPSIKYHIVYKTNGDRFMDESKLAHIEALKKNSDGSVAEFTYHKAHVFKIPCPNIGSLWPSTMTEQH